MAILPLWWPAADTIRIDTDPGDLPAGVLSDAVNVILNRPHGVVTPRGGSRTLMSEDSAVTNGHPMKPMGNSSFDWSATVLKLLHDEVNQRLWALVRSQAGKAKLYAADLTADSPGFGNGSAELSIDDTHPIAMALADGKVYIAAGTTGTSGNVVATYGTPPTLSTNALFPEQPASIAVSTANPGTLTALTGYIYAICAKDSTTGARGPLRQAASTGAFVTQDPAITVGGTGSAVTWDKIEIYRTTDGGAVLRYLAEVANPGAGTVVYNDTTPDDRLSLLVAPARVGRTPTARFCLYWEGRMIWLFRTETGADPNAGYYSEVNHPFAVDPIANSLEFRRNDGDQITGAIVLRNRLFVFKSGNIFEVSKDEILRLRVDPIMNDQRIGCASPNTLIDVEGRCLGLGWAGLFQFDGESASIIPGPLAQTVAERQVWANLWDDPRRYLQFLARNAFTSTKTFHFKVYFMSSASHVPGVDAPVLLLQSSVTPERFRSGGFQIPSGGVTIPAGDETHIEARAEDNELTRGATYYPWIEVIDTANLLVVHTEAQSPYYHIPYEQASFAVNWGLRGYFFALNDWPRGEYRLYVAAPDSTVIDQVWILDYRAWFDSGAARWRRETMTASAGLVVKGVSIDSGNRNLVGRIVGDNHGCVWIENYGQTDRAVARTSAISTAQRIGTGGTLAYGLGVWVLTPAGSPSWPTTGGKMKGEVLVIRDALNQTYSGVITDSTASTVTVSKWMESRDPTLGTVDWAVGGIDARVDYYPIPLSADASKMGIIRDIFVQGGGNPDPVDVEIWPTNQPELMGPLAEQRLDAQRYRVEGLTCGAGGVERAPARGRALYCGARVGSYLPGLAWKLARVGLGVVPADGLR